MTPEERKIIKEYETSFSSREELLAYQKRWGKPDPDGDYYSGNPYNPYDASPVDPFNCSNDILK